MGSLDDHLSHLEAAGLIQLAQQNPEMEYLFRHALVQQAAYDSLLKQDRRTLHRAVGEALEAAYPDRLDELAAVLGGHFAEAGEPARALAYFTRAADQAAARYANAEAALLYNQALAIALADASLPADLIALFSGLGKALQHDSRHAEALAVFQRMEQAGQERADRRMALAALRGQIILLSTSTPVHDPGRAAALAEQALSMARELGDRREEASVLWNLMLIAKFDGRALDAVRYGEESLAAAREVAARTGDIEQLAYTLNDLATHAYLDADNLQAAVAALLEARELWQRLGDRAMLADNYASLGTSYAMLGEVEEGLAHMRVARRISEEIGNLWGQSFSRYTEGDIYLERGEISRGLAVMQECVTLGEQAGFLFALSYTGTNLSTYLGRLGQPERALVMCEDIVRRIETGLPHALPGALAGMARLHLLLGNVPAAAEAMARADRLLARDAHIPVYVRVQTDIPRGELALAEGRPADAAAEAGALADLLARIGVPTYEIEARLLLARALLAQGQPEKAAEALARARQVAASRGLRRLLWEVHAALADLADRQGFAEEAAVLRTEAAGHLRFVIGNIDEPDLRAAFTALPAVRAVLEA